MSFHSDLAGSLPFQWELVYRRDESCWSVTPRLEVPNDSTPAELLMNIVTLAALIVILSPGNELQAEVIINCNQGDGYYSRSSGIWREFTCQEPKPPHYVFCRVGTQHCTWECVNQAPTDIACSQNFCRGPYGNVTCCDGSCTF